MEKLIEDLINRLENKKTDDERHIDNLDECSILRKKLSENELFLISGKNIAYDFCIHELTRIVEIYKENKIIKNSKN
jgi:hypothetical protein